MHKYNTILSKKAVIFSYFFFKGINAFIQQGHVKLTAKTFTVLQKISNKGCGFELSIRDVTITGLR